METKHYQLSIHTYYSRQVWVFGVLVSWHHFVRFCWDQKHSSGTVSKREFCRWKKAVKDNDLDVHHVRGPSKVGDKCLALEHYSINRGSK